MAGHSSLNRVSISLFGGVNANDQQDSLLGPRFAMMGVVETPESINTDFYPEGIGRRKGSKTVSSITYAAGFTPTAGENVVGIASYKHPKTGNRIPVVVTSKRILVHATNASNDSGQTIDTHIPYAVERAFSFNPEITAVSFVEFENHLLIASGRKNPIVVLSNNSQGAGQAIDDFFYRDGIDYTVSAKLSTSRFAIVGGTDITNIRPGHAVGSFRSDTVTLIPKAYVISVDYVNNIVETFSGLGTATAGDSLRLTNQFREFRRGESSVSATAYNITGVIYGADEIALLHNRLIYAGGTRVAEYTPPYAAASSGIWDISAGGFVGAESGIIAIKPFVQKGFGSPDASIYLFTEKGIASQTGMGEFDVMSQITQSGAVVNGQCVAQIENWLVYLTRDKQLRAVSGRFDIDIGRRLKSRVGGTGPLDRMNVDASLNTAFLFYDTKKKKLYAHFSTGSSFVNDACIVLDFEHGEPVAGEPEEVFEKRVRCLDWRVDTPTANEGFRAMTVINNELIGIRQDGGMWIPNSGDVDFGVNKIAANWKTPQIAAGRPATEKNFVKARLATLNLGPHSNVLSKFRNRGTTETDVLTFEQSNTAGIVVRGVDLNEYAYSLQLNVRNENSLSSEPWVLTGIEVDYTVGAEVI